MEETREQLRIALDSVRDPDLYRVRNARHAIDLSRAVRALDEDKPRAALAWLEAFDKKAAASRQFAIIQARDKKRVGELWDAVISLADTARTRIEGDLH